MSNEQLIAFIRNEFVRGIDRTTVIQSLITAGWKVEDINVAIAAIDSAVGTTVSSVPQVPQSQYVPAPTVQAVKYAGFWVRVAAWFVDALLVGLPLGILSQIFGDTIYTSILVIIVFWGYTFFMVTSYQATLGKMVVGLRIQGSNGEKIGFGRVFMREFIGKILSSLVLSVGYLMVAWTNKKQGLHDKIADTVVIEKDPNKSKTGWVVFAVLATLVVPVFLVIALYSFILLAKGVSTIESKDSMNQRDLWISQVVSGQVSNFQLMEQPNGYSKIFYEVNGKPNMSVCVKGSCPIPGKTVLNIAEDLDSVLVGKESIFLFGSAISALDLKTGVQRWNTLEEHFLAKFTETATNLILTAPYKIAALDKNNGVKKWEYTSNKSQSPADFLRSSIIDGSKIYVSGDSGTIYVFDENSGEKLKSFPLGPDATFSRFFGRLNNGSLCLDDQKKISLFDPGSGRLSGVFSIGGEKRSVNGLLCSGNSLYVVENIVWEYTDKEPSKIRKTLYKFSADGTKLWSSNFYQSESDDLPTVSLDQTKLFFSRYNSVSKNYEVVVSSEKPENVQWSYSMGSSRVHILGEDSGVLYVLGDNYIDECSGQCFSGEIKAFDLEKGTLLRSFPIDEQIQANAWSYNQGIFYYSTYGASSYVHALQVR